MGIEEKKYEGVLDNEEGHFLHHQFLQADVIAMYRSLTNARKAIQTLQQQVKSAGTNATEALKTSKNLGESMLKNMSMLSQEKSLCIRSHSVSAEFMYQCPPKGYRVELCPNVPIVLSALLLEKGITYQKGITFAYIEDEAVKESFILIAGRSLELTLLKRQAGSCKVVFLHIEDEVCTLESNDVKSSE